MNQVSSPRRRRVAIYARVSSSKQNEEKTIESQVTLLVEYAKQMDFEIPEGWVFQDNGVSGNTIQRAALDNLRDLVASGSPDAVLIYHPDRLARKYVYQAVLLDEFARCAVEVIFYKNKKAETPEEHLLEQFQGIFAEYERTQITERCRRGRLHKARQGSITARPNAPYGYRYVRDERTTRARYEIHQEEAKTVLRIFEMYATENRSIKFIAAFMNESGKKPRISHHGWHTSTIRTMLKNRTYTGTAIFGKTERCDGDSQKIVRTPKSGRMQISKHAKKMSPEEQWITISVPAIVSEDLYRTVQEKLDHVKRFSFRNTKVPSILQGILVCGKCGGSYYKKSRINRHTYYSCYHNISKGDKKCGNRSIRQKGLDDYIWAWVIDMLQNPELIEKEIRRRSEEDPERKHATDRKVSLQREMNRFSTSRNKLLDAYTTGECLSLEELKKRMSLLNQNMEQIERELAVIDAQMADEERIKQSHLTLEKFAASLANSSENLSIAEKQQVVRSLIHEVVIFDDVIKIRHCIPIRKDAITNREKCLLQPKRFGKASRG
jgi:site-specific DNA recombinase